MLERVLSREHAPGDAERGHAHDPGSSSASGRLLEGGFSEVARIVHGHPTLSEAVMEAARAADGWLIHG